MPTGGYSGKKKATTDTTPTLEQAPTNTAHTNKPPKQQQASPSSLPRYLPSRETKAFEVRINAGEPCLSVQYNPHELIAELNKLFGLLYFGFGVPPSILVKADSPLAGLFTSWFAFGATQSLPNSGERKQRRFSPEEIVASMKSIADGAYDRPTEEFVQRVKQLAQGGSEETSKYLYGVGRWTTLATDYVAQHLPEKLQSALIQLALEAQVHSLSVSAEERGFRKVGSEQGLVDSILATEEKQIKTRLRTRRAGGSPAKYDFSSLPMFYEHGKKHFREARRVLAAIDDPPRDRAHRVVSEARGEIDSDLIDRMLDGQDYLATQSHLAVEWAARRCGLPADRGDEYPTTYLLQVLSKTKRKK
jgi:hypothetical protein